MCNQVCPPNSTQHFIKEGDTFWRLSQTYGVSVQSISDLNPGVNPQNLQIGSTVCIPALPTPYAPQMQPAACPEGTFPYTIQTGDTFWRLSQTYGVSLQSIIDANPGVDPQNLQIGSAVCIPALPTPYATPMQPAACPEGNFAYTIQAGDTFWRLSQTYGVSLQSIIDANPGVDPQNLQIGSAVCIPALPTPYATPMQPAACPEGNFAYTIQAGDTFWRLSQTYGVSLQSIIDANPGVDPQNLQIGSAVCIPALPTPYATPMQPAACPEGTFPYTIQTGDTFWRLSQTYGVSLQSIIDANPGVDPQNLQIGSTVCIPAGPTPQAPQMPQTPQMPPVLPGTCPVGTFPYTVQTGDTLWNLSQTYGASAESIFDINPGVDPLNLQIGSTICIPAVPIPLTPSSYFAYLVKRCDTICRIARKFYVSEESILEINPEIDPRCLVVGTIIFVPINCCGPNTFRYAVREGDTLNTIANRFNVCPLDLIAANPNTDFEHLVRCQIICIPSA